MATKTSGTPDSIPSLANTSKGSTDTEDLNRVLFEDLQGDETPKIKNNLGRPGACDDTASVGSSNSSGVPVGPPVQRHKTDPASLSDYEEILVRGKTTSESISPLKFEDDEPKPVGIHREEQDSQSEVYVNKASCHSGLNLSPSKLADVFSLFLRSQGDKPPHPIISSKSDSSEAPVGPPVEPHETDPAALSDYYEELLARGRTPASGSISPLKIEEDEPQPVVGIHRKEQDSHSEVYVDKATCHSLSPGKLADVFTDFLRSQGDQPPHPIISSPPNGSPTLSSPPNGSPTSVTVEDCGDDAATEVTSNTVPSVVQRMPRLESLKRECQALRKIIRADSSSMLHLKTDLETLRKDMTNNVAKIQQLQRKLVVVERERDQQKVREREHKEAVKALKSELDSINVSKLELDQLRMENELFAAQIIENEIELRKCEISLEAERAKNSKLNDRCMEKPSVQKEDSNTNGGGREPLDLATKIFALEVRLANMEAEREETKQTPCTEARESGEELRGDEVEVTLNGPICAEDGFDCGAKTGPICAADGVDCGAKTVGVCGSWNDFCDCFPSTRTDDGS